MKKDYGFGQAADLLSRLTLDERERILSKIEEEEPELAEKLRKNFYCFEDLLYLTPHMLTDLLREVDIELMGLALRGGSEQLREFILSNISSTMNKDLLEILNGPLRPVSHVQEAIGKVMAIVVVKIDRGELVLSKEGQGTIID